MAVIVTGVAAVVVLPVVWVAMAAVIAAAMGAWSFVVARRAAPTSVHAVPG